MLKNRLMREQEENHMFLKATSLSDESGFTLIEILAAIILLGIALLSLAVFMHQNFLIIQENKQKEEAIFACEDLKEWLTYRGTNQDITNLNPFVLVEEKESSRLNEDEKQRRAHFILDETGIQKTADGEYLYDEIPRDLSIDRGKIVSKVRYDFTAKHLPEELKKDETNKLYIGEYIGAKKEEFKFLVEVIVTRKNYFDNYDPRKQGVGLTIIIYSKFTGKILTEGYLNWVADY